MPFSNVWTARPRLSIEGSSDCLFVARCPGPLGLRYNRPILSAHPNPCRPLVALSSHPSLPLKPSFKRRSSRNSKTSAEKSDLTVPAYFFARQKIYCRIHERWRRTDRTATTTANSTSSPSTVPTVERYRKGGDLPHHALPPRFRLYGNDLSSRDHQVRPLTRKGWGMGALSPTSTTTACRISNVTGFGATRS